MLWSYSSSCLLVQSPDVAKVKEELSRLRKRLKAASKLVEEKQKLFKEQSKLTAKLQSDVEKVTDGEDTLQTRNSAQADMACIPGLLPSMAAKAVHILSWRW